MAFQMTIDDMAYVLQATTQICSSLDIQVILTRCLDFFKTRMPLDRIAMNIYDPGTRSILNIAAAEQKDFIISQDRVVLPPEAGDMIEKDTGKSVYVFNRPEENFLARFMWKAMGGVKMSAMILRLTIEEEKLGVVAFQARGNNQYTKEHARLIQLIHDPFAMAMSNTLKHQEILRLKDLLMDDNQYLNRQLHHIAGDQIVGSEYGLKDVMEMVKQIAPQKSQVLLLGETGTGKEVIANAIHFWSPRAANPFIKVNCGAIPENLIDSDLFGHEKGAFTGALTQKRGRFERANSGTLFLDEIGELPLEVQARLLRVLEHKEIERVGGTCPIPVDIRVIAATHRDLPELVRTGRFREDLWYRLNVFPISIPPLRERRTDIPALALYFIEKKKREMNFPGEPILAPGAIEKLKRHNWPGNVRELQNLVERTLIKNMGCLPVNPLNFEDLKPDVPDSLPHQDAETITGPLLLDQVLADHIQKVLKMTNGKIQGKHSASELLGLHPNTLRNKMDKLEIPYGRKVELNCEGLLRRRPQKKI
ncbi:sigma-54-dependent Fis family transcriptional regulator [Desulfobacter sp.]|uniref:sigma-54-dependent Fis family transcriptional regulator n=1 Tax=Desulfobacter sp. TaxID=2294 RepID=UPI003D0E13FD